MNYRFKSTGSLGGMYQNIKARVIPGKSNGFLPLFLQSRILFYGIVILLFLKIAINGLFIPFPANYFFADITKIDLLHLLNQNRTDNALPALAENEKLDVAAYLKAQDMVRNGYFSHTSPLGTTPWFWFGEAGYEYAYAGENLAIGFVDSKSLYDAWLDSPSHKANLLNPKYQEVGYAVVRGFGENNTIVVVQLFGSAAVKEPVKTPIVKPNNIMETLKTQPETKEASLEPAVIQNPKNNQQKVLAQSTESSAIENSNADFNHNPYFAFLHFIVYDSANALQYASYGLLGLMLSCLFFSIVVNFYNNKSVPILRPIALTIILFMTTLINQEIIFRMLPHYIAL